MNEIIMKIVNEHDLVILINNTMCIYYNDERTLNIADMNEKYINVSIIEACMIMKKIFKLKTFNTKIK